MKTPKLTILAGRNKADPEKTILPSIVFINANHPAFEDVRMPGFMIAIGIWDFSVKICILFK